MEVYLDNSATTRCSERVRDIVLHTMDAAYGNPSSLHTKGMEAEKYVRDAARKIAKTLKVREKEICFTSGGTESNNLALIGSAFAGRRRGKRIISTAVEHSSVSHALKFLEGHGFEVVYLPVDRDGVISPEALEEAVNDDTILVSIMHVNNEIGAIEPVEQAGEIIQRKNPGALFHVDAVQSYGKIPIRPAQWGISLLSVSGHKIHGPKGAGFLYIREKTKIEPLSYGGGQQSGMRSGTLNVPGIAGLGEAAWEMHENLEENRERLYQLREDFAGRVTGIEGIVINGRSGRGSAPHIVSVSIPGVRSEVMLHALEAEGIYVSAGSACSSHRTAGSATLRAAGLPPQLLDATLRFSFSVSTSREEIDYTVEKMRELVPQLRRYT